MMVPRDSQHQRARDFFRDMASGSRLLTSNYVLAETVTYLIYHGARQAALRFRDMVEAAVSTRLLEVAWATPEVDEAAWRYVERFDDQTFSFCDCASFAICETRGVDFVFGFDGDFRSAGLLIRP